VFPALDTIISSAETLHTGVCRYRTKEPGEAIEKESQACWDPDLDEVENVACATMQAPITVALKHSVIFLLNIAQYCYCRHLRIHRQTTKFYRVMSSDPERAVNALKAAENCLIVASDGCMFEKGLGPVVTPEAIILLVLERLSKGVYKGGTIDIIDVYERVVEKLVRHDSLRHFRNGSG
jgi:hypothetical protein